MYNQKLSSIATKFISPLEANKTVKDAILKMKEDSISSMVIVDKHSKPIGIFTEYDVLKIVASLSNHDVLIEEVMSKNVFYINENIYVHDAYVLMEQRGFRHVIVVDDEEKYVGIASEGDFLRHMGFEDIAKNKTIEDAMHESILTIEQDSSLRETASLMAEKKCDYAIITKDQKPVGIINERDITHYCSKKEILENETISVIRQHKMYLINKSVSLEKASQMMREHGVHQLIVVDDVKNLIGLVKRHDILKAIHGSYFDYLLQTINSKTENEKVLRSHKEELEKLANYDQLTGLPNRLFFQTYLKKSLAKAIRSKQTLGLLVLDLDRFKSINDSYGHTVGDELLKTISLRLVQRVREGDLVARLGGDEFAIVLEDLSKEDDIVGVTNSILQTISNTCKLSNGVEVSIEASVGIVLAPKNAKTFEQILQYADSALYQAKSEGRGIFQFYADEMTEKILQKTAYEQALRSAISQNQLELYYQPQVHIKTGKIISAEALIRWNYPNIGMILPSIFIPIAEHTGLINPIGEWVIHEACRQGKIWLDKGYHLIIAVNVSPNQVKFQNIPLVVSEALKASGYHADKLEIELTESSFMQREEQTVEMLHALRAKGIRLAIDDFGTGYSSLSYLTRFPIDVLKIDKSFIDNIPYEKESSTIVVAIIEMSKALGFQVLAEGVEQQEQLDFLAEKGCNIYQGYIKSKPIPAQEFEKLLEEQNH